MDCPWSVIAPQRVQNASGREFIISNHAMLQFTERWNKLTGKQKNTPFPAIHRRFTKLFVCASPVERKNKVLQLLNHNFQDAEYFLCDAWVFVVSDNAILTCYHKPDHRKLYA